MHLLIDIGNSTIVVAFANDAKEIIYNWRFKTKKDDTVTAFRYELKAGVRKSGVELEEISSVSISSVVPEVNDDIAQAIYDLVGVTPHFFNLQDAQKCIAIKVESPSQLGKDRIADAIAAAKYHGVPAIVFDMGTATTVGVVNESGCFVGGMIIPGVKTSLNALSSRASQLPSISLEKPRHIIGENTVECMQSGILYGTAAMVDGIIDRLRPMFNVEPHVVATGGMSSKIIPFCNHKIEHDAYLQLKGILLATADYIK